jgi:dTDP-glucose 4,6-dehydratase
MRKYLVTGGAGFIGSNFIRYLLEKYDDAKVVNLDKLTYAGNLENLTDVENDPRYTFVKGDIADNAVVSSLMKDGMDYVVNFAAETHVDRSIGDPTDFIRTDVFGAYVLLENSKEHGVKRFIQISTDEVYGSISEGYATEESPLMPSNPYSASKAGADRLAYSYYATYGLPVIVTRASNNFGPNQYPEKLIPLFVTNAIEDIPLPLYGDGRNVRDWLYVRDHCDAVDFIVEKGVDGEVYNVAGGNEKMNIDITNFIVDFLGKPKSIIKPVKDRLGHDRRYALSGEKLSKLGWSPAGEFEQEMRDTIDWYVNNPQWWKKIKSGEFKEYYLRQYGNR